jgi:tRNA-(ms[2]io[6]A)-hydroxylase
MNDVWSVSHYFFIYFNYTTFLNFARQYSEKVDVEQRWKEWIAYETEIISKYGNKETVHG